MPNAFATTSNISADPTANTANTVPITQATTAFLAIPILSGAPAAVRYKIPAITQPTTTIGIAISVAAVSTLHAILPKVAPPANAKEGKTTKEITDFLNISATAVDFHRKNIRMKLGIKNKKTNLRSFLLSMPSKTDS